MKGISLRWVKVIEVAIRYKHL